MSNSNEATLFRIQIFIADKIRKRCPLSMSAKNGCYLVRMDLAYVEIRMYNEKDDLYVLNTVDFKQIYAYIDDHQQYLL